jgi:uncharacterized membrane protein AbrB (regulator of aidB expression)
VLTAAPTIGMRFVHPPAALMLGPIMASVVIAICVPGSGSETSLSLSLYTQAVIGGRLIARLF